MSDLKDLAREYAALVPEWPQPGMRCVDPMDSQQSFRLVRQGWHAEHCGHPDTIFWHGDEKSTGLIHAIAAGPDLDDNATLGALLLGLGDRIRIEREESGEWFVRFANTANDLLWFGKVCQTRGEAVIRACIAQAKDKVTP